MSAWTEDRVARLQKLWLEGRTAEFVARDLGAGVSRSAVLGKVYRMGLSALRAAPAKSRLRPQPHSARRSLDGQGVQIGKTERRCTVVSAVVPSPPPERGTRSILTVGRRDCRWPIGDPLEADFSVCGRGVSRGGYCADHAAIAYRGAPRPTESLFRRASVA